MEFLFGKRKTIEQQLRENQRALNKTIRELEREKVRLENEEKKVIMDIKKMAKQGQMDAVKIMAKDLAVSLKIQTVRSTNAMAQAMTGVTKTMQRMNKSMNLPQLQKIMMEFEKQTEIMDMKSDMMADAIDDAIGEDGDYEESETVVNQVLDELGIEMSDRLSGLPSGTSSLGAEALSNRNKPTAVAAGSNGPDSFDKPGEGMGTGATGASTNNEDDDLEARLNRLKRS